MLGKCCKRDSFCAEAFFLIQQKKEERERKLASYGWEILAASAKDNYQNQEPEGFMFLLQSVPRTQEGPRDKPNHTAKIHIDKLRLQLKLSAPVNLIITSVRNLA